MQIIRLFYIKKAAVASTTAAFINVNPLCYFTTAP